MDDGENGGGDEAEDFDNMTCTLDNKTLKRIKKYLRVLFSDSGIGYCRIRQKPIKRLNSSILDGEVVMKRIWFWLQKKKRIEKRACGKCCLNCKYYRQCRMDGTF